MHHPERERTHPHAPQHPPGAGPDPLRWYALALLAVAQFMVILDITVVNVALPAIGAELALSRSGLAWVVTAYTIAFGGLMMLGGRLADLLGRRRVFLTGLALFTLASLAAGLATTGAALITARVVQGVGAALLSPAALSIITSTFHGRERHKALGVWAALGGTGAAAGVLLGGVMVAGPGWEWIFFVNVPVGALLTLLTSRAVADMPPTPGRLDVPGALLATGASAALVYGLVTAGDTGWTAPLALLPIAAGVALAVSFVLVERRTAAPLVRPDILARRPVVAGLLIMLAATATLISGFFLTSLLLQRSLGWDALATGLLFLAPAAATAVGAHVAARMVARVGARPVAATGFVLAAAGMGWLALAPEGSGALLTVLPGFTVAAAGLGAAFVTATTSAMTSVEHAHTGMASGTVNTAHEWGASLGVALSSVLAAASLDTAALPAPLSGFTDAYTAWALVAVVVGGVATLVLPAGRPASTDGPMMAH